MAEKFELTKNASGKFHFNLKAGNGQLIGMSEMYSSVPVMENGIAPVRTNGPTALTQDNT